MKKNLHPDISPPALGQAIADGDSKQDGIQSDVNASALFSPGIIGQNDSGAKQPNASLTASSEKSKKHKKKKSNVTEVPKQTEEPTWSTTSTGQLTTLGAFVWFAGGAAIGGVVLLIALKPPRFFWTKKPTKEVKEVDSEVCEDGS